MKHEVTDEMLARIDAVVSGHEHQREYPAAYRPPLVPDRFTMFGPFQLFDYMVPAMLAVAGAFDGLARQLRVFLQASLDAFGALVAAINRRTPVPYKRNNRRYGR